MLHKHSIYCPVQGCSLSVWYRNCTGIPGTLFNWIGNEFKSIFTGGTNKWLQSQLLEWLTFTHGEKTWIVQTCMYITFCSKNKPMIFFFFFFWGGGGGERIFANPHHLLLFCLVTDDVSGFIGPLTHPRKMSTKRGLYDISYHNSWYRSRKIKEDSSTEREKSPLQFEPIFITVQCTSRSQDFF